MPFIFFPPLFRIVEIVICSYCHLSAYIARSVPNKLFVLFWSVVSDDTVCNAKMAKIHAILANGKGLTVLKREDDSY